MPANAGHADTDLQAWWHNILRPALKEKLDGARERGATARVLDSSTDEIAVFLWKGDPITIELKGELVRVHSPGRRPAAQYCPLRVDEVIKTINRAVNDQRIQRARSVTDAPVA